MVDSKTSDNKQHIHCCQTNGHLSEPRTCNQGRNNPNVGVHVFVGVDDGFPCFSCNSCMWKSTSVLLSHELFVEMRCPKLNSRKAFHRIEHTAFLKIILVDTRNFQSKEVSIRETV